SVKGGAAPVDHHVHVISRGKGLAGLCGQEGDTTSTVTQKRFTWRRPIRKLKTSVLMSASGITDIHQADEQYAARLLDLAVYFPGPGRFHLLALDAYLDENGTVDKDKTDMYISNDYVVELSKCLNGLLEKKTRALPERFKKDKRFAPMISVHPYRKDALRELRKFKGVAKFVKWLPSVMGINPADERIGPFFETMADLGMVLLSHTGQETTLKAPDCEQWHSNPLLLKHALEKGVTVVMAHSGRDGDNDPRKTKKNDSCDSGGERKPNFDLFLEMMDDPRYIGRLFGEISALTIKNTLGHLRRIIERDSLRHRMVYGSDYPLPAASALNPTGAMTGEEFGYITEAEKRALDKIYGINPLLFDFVLQRTIRLRDGRRMPEEFFLSLEHNLKRLKKAPGRRN
ncbi:MAG: amidohydrolase family protein, partial [bacterium]